MSVPLAHSVHGDPSAPAVFLSPSLGTTAQMWDELAADLGAFRVVRYDTRGHGGSPVPDGPYSVSELASDVVALADSLGIERFAFVGISLGGAIGQTLAIEQSSRVTSLVLCCTSPVFGEPSTWHERAAQVRADGMGWLAEPTRDRWFTPEFQSAHPAEVDRFIAMITSTPPEGYAACCDALSAFDTSARLGRISAPTRVIAGSEDQVSPPSVARVLAETIPDADLVVLDGVAHIASVAAPTEFNAAVREHLERTT